MMVISCGCPRASCKLKSSPVPFRVELAEAPPDSETVKLPVRAPVVCGVNATLIVQLEFAPRMDVQDVLCSVKLPGVVDGLKPIVTPVTALGELLVSVNV